MLPPGCCHGRVHVRIFRRIVSNAYGQRKSILNRPFSEPGTHSGTAADLKGCSSAWNNGPSLFAYSNMKVIGAAHDISYREICICYEIGNHGIDSSVFLLERITLDEQLSIRVRYSLFQLVSYTRCHAADNLVKWSCQTFGLRLSSKRVRDVLPPNLNTTKYLLV